MGTMASMYWTPEQWQNHYERTLPLLKMALNDPEHYCINPECKDTNWGGIDRVHIRDDNECPEFVPLDRINLTNRIVHFQNAIEKYHAKREEEINRLADKIMKELK